MKKGLTIFLQVVIVAVSIAMLAALILEPRFEGVNANATSFHDIYLDDPFLAYIYIAFISAYVGAYQAFKLLNYIRRNEEFSQPAVKALRALKYASLIFAGFIVGAEIMIMAHRNESDDIAGGVMMGLFLILVSVVVAANAAMHERIWQKGIDIKTENDLTV